MSNLASAAKNRLKEAEEGEAKMPKVRQLHRLLDSYSSLSKLAESLAERFESDIKETVIEEEKEEESDSPRLVGRNKSDGLPNKRQKK